MMKFLLMASTSLMLAMPLTLGMLAGEGLPPAFGYRNTYNSYDNLTTYTFSACDLGTAHSKRLIVVGVYIANEGISTVTVGGVSATLVITDVIFGHEVALYRASVPSGTTGDIVVTAGDTATACRVHVWGGYPASVTPVDSYSGGSGAKPRILANLAKTNGGFTCIMVYVANDSAIAVTQNGAETVIENHDTAGDTSNRHGAYSHINTATTIIDDYSIGWGSGPDGLGLGATWGP